MACFRVLATVAGSSHDALALSRSRHPDRRAPIVVCPAGYRLGAAMNWLQIGLSLALLLILVAVGIDSAAMLICTAQGVPNCGW